MKKKRFLRFLSVCLIFLLSAMTPISSLSLFKAYKVKAANEPFSINSMLKNGKNHETIILGLAAVVVGLAFETQEQIEATGKIVKEELVKAGHSVSEVVTGNNVKFTPFLKQAMLAGRERITTIYYDILNVVKSPQSASVNRWGEGQYQIQFVNQPSFKVSPGNTVKITMNCKTTADAKILSFNPPIAEGIWGFTNIIGSYTGTQVIISAVYIGQSETTLSGVTFISNDDTRPVGFNAEVYGKSVDMTGVKQQTGAIVQDVPDDDEFVWNPEADLTGVNSRTIGRVATDSAGVLDKQQGLLESILEGIKAIPKALSGGIDTTVPQEVSLDFSAFKAIDLTKKFPFSIPWDILRSFGSFMNVSEKAPSWTLDFGAFSSLNVDAKYTIDLSMFNTLAAIVRWGILIIFQIGLILKTRDIIRG